MRWILSLSVVSICIVTVCWATLTEEEIAIFRSYGVTVSDHDDDTYLFEHNGIPDHETGDFPNADNPNDIEEQEHMYYIPKVPTDVEEPGCLSLGTIAAAVNGVPYFNPYSALGYNAVEGEGAEVFDDCTGHPQASGVYHYHAAPACLYNPSENMQLLGVALDGYPIYGPKDENGVELTTSDLDECHGRWFNGRYMYVITNDFPYVLSCYKAEVHASNGGMAGRKRRQAPGGGGMGPPGGGGSDWDSCYAVCENPGADDTCTEVLIPGSNYDGSTVVPPTDDNSAAREVSAFVLCGLGLLMSRILQI